MSKYVYSIKFLYIILITSKITSQKLTIIFKEVKDTSLDLPKLHKLNDILIISVLGVICDADT